MNELFAVFGIMTAGLVGLLLLIGIPIWAGTYYSDRANCRNWGDQANRVTEFRVLVEPLGLPARWDCFTPVENGRWLPIDRLREFDE